MTAHPTERSLGRRALELWRRSRVSLLAVATLTTVTLGYIGASRAAAVPDGLLDRLYITVQMFVLDASIDPPIPLEFQIARLVAPVLLGYAALTAALVLFSEHALRLRGRRASGHTVVVGIGRRGLLLSQSLTGDESHPAWVVGLDRRTDTAESVQARRRRIPVLNGDGADTTSLQRVGVRRANNVVILTGDDLTNLKVAARVSRVLADVRRREPVTVHVTLQDIELWRAIRPDSLAVDPAAPVRLEFVCTQQRAAVELVGALPDSAFLDREHLLLVVEDPLGEAILAEAVRRAQLLGVQRLAISAVGEDSDELVRRWHARHPLLSEVADVSAIPASVAALAPALLESAQRARAAIVALTDERAALTAALHLARRHAVPPRRLVLAVGDHALEAALPSETGLGIRVVGAVTSTLDRDLLLDGTRERIARARHAHHVRERRAVDGGAAPDPSMLPWNQLSQPLREANLAFADRVAGVLEVVDGAVVPSDIGPLRRGDLQLDEDVLELLAEREHDLWMAEKERQGYRPGPVRNDGPGDRTHPSMKPYAELSQEEREKDRSSIRELPAILAAAGLAIVIRGRTERESVRAE